MPGDGDNPQEVSRPRDSNEEKAGRAFEPRADVSRAGGERGSQRGSDEGSVDITRREFRQSGANGAESSPRGRSEIQERVNQRPEERAERGALAERPDRVGFEYGKSTLSPQGARQVEALASRVKEDVARGGVVFLKGHASRPGNEDFNYELSRQRAETVRSELARHGVDPERIKTSWNGEGDAKVRGATDGKDDRNDRSVTWEVVSAPRPVDRTEPELPPDIGRKVADQFTRDKDYDPDKEGPQLVKTLAKDAAKPSLSTIPKAVYEGGQYVFKWGVDTIKTTEAFKKINDDLVPSAVNRIGELAGHQRLLPVRDGTSAYAEAGRTAGENVYANLSDQDKRALLEALRDPEKVSQLRYQIYDAMKNKLEGRNR